MMSVSWTQRIGEQRERTCSTEYAVENTNGNDSTGVSGAKHAENEGGTCDGAYEDCIEWTPDVPNEVGDDTADLRGGLERIQATQREKDTHDRGTVEDGDGVECKVLVDPVLDGVQLQVEDRSENAKDIEEGTVNDIRRSSQPK